MSLEKLLAMAEGKEVIKKAFQDVKNEIMTSTLIRLSGDNLGKELDKSIDEFMAVQDKTDETSQGVSKIIAAHVKKMFYVRWLIKTRTPSAKDTRYHVRGIHD